LRLLDLLITFMKIGLFSFGGGYAVVPLIAVEVVQLHHWFTAPEFANMLAMSQLVPGTLLGNVATFIGYRIWGWPGAVIALLGVVIPTSLVMGAVTYYYDRLQGHPLFQRVMDGIYPTLVALLASAMFFFAGNTHFTWQIILIILLSCGAMASRRLSVFWVLLGTAILGFLL
jgi:chromate transporter